MRGESPGRALRGVGGGDDAGAGRAAERVGEAVGARAEDLVAARLAEAERGLDLRPHAARGALALDVVSVDEARRHLADGQFPAGSMGPKIEAALGFVEAGGDEVLITSPDRLADALRGTTGTRIVAAAHAA